MPGQSRAALIAGQDIIPAPPSVIEDHPGAVNTHQQAFNERLGVRLLEPLAVDGGIIPAGTVVDSHMIFLNTEGPTEVIDWGVVWTFDGPVIGVMSDAEGTLEAASSAILGAPGTTYPEAFHHRGLEPGDSYTVIGTEITVNMRVTEPGDWIRVVTLSPLVGGIAEPPPLAGSAEQSGAPGEGSGWSGRNYGAPAAGLAVALLALTAGAWYARRRWGRQGFPYAARCQAGTTPSMTRKLFFLFSQERLQRKVR
jgi:hypothetical protein